MVREALRERFVHVLRELGGSAGLDDKIEMNRRMNETLEAMARAIFKDWFVDFGPTRAKVAGQNPYLPSDLWSLFPDRLTFCLEAAILSRKRSLVTSRSN